MGQESSAGPSVYLQCSHAVRTKIGWARLEFELGLSSHVRLDSTRATLVRHSSSTHVCNYASVRVLRTYVLEHDMHCSTSALCK